MLTVCNSSPRNCLSLLYVTIKPVMTVGKISIAIKHYRRDDPCIIHHVDVDDNGYFRDADKYFGLIISYHPTKDIPITTAQYLHQRIRSAGQPPECPRMG
ncbi:hypothetical protein BYT27DRAFT_6766986 [Phlegmacium glaucopus]|nr:hypothetical protein BYT27DRAFT_6766986 [Phlegmacium glaucopus]